MIEDQDIPAFDPEDPFSRPPTNDERMMVAGRFDLLGPAMKSLFQGKRTSALREEGVEKIANQPEASKEEIDALNQTLREMGESVEQSSDLPPGSVEVGFPGEKDVEPGQPLDVQRMADRVYNPQPTDIAEMAERVYGGGRTQARNLNFDYMEATDAAKSYVNALSEDAGGFMEQRRGVRPHEETRKAAMQEDLTQLIGGKPGTAWNAEQLVAGRHLVLRLAEDAMNLSDKIQATGGSTEEQAKLLRIHQSLLATQRAVQGGVAEAGRALNSMQMVAGPAFQKERIQQLEEIVARGGGTKNVKSLAAIYNNAATPGDAANKASKLGTFGRRLSRSVQEMWINSILSGFPTHLVNAMGNSLAQMYETTVIKPLAIPIGMTRQGVQKLAGKEAQQRMLAMEIPAELVGKTQGIADTFIAMARERLDYIKKLDAEQKIDNPEFKAISSRNWNVSPTSLGGQTLDVVGEIIRGPGTVLAIADDVFKSMVYRGEINAQAIREAQSEGLYGKAFSKRVYELMQDPSADMHLAAKQEAEKLTFTASLNKDYGPLQWLGSMLQVGGEKYPLINYFIPFKRTPTQIAAYMLENSAIAPLTTGWRADIAAGGIRADKAMARLTMAVATTWTVWQLAVDGRITGQGPRDYKVRRALEETGWQANSIRIGGKYYEINRLDPIGGLLLNVSNAADLVTYGDDEETNAQIVSATIGGVLQNFSSKTYMEGFHRAVGLIAGGKDADREFSAFIRRISTGFVPFSSALRTFRRGEDEVIRRVKNNNDFVQTVLNGYSNMIPGWSQSLPPIRYWNGKIATLEGNRYWRSMSPIRQASLTGDKASIELSDNGIGFQEPSYLLRVKVTGDVPLNLYEVDVSGQLYDEYLKLVGEARYEEVNRTLRRMGEKRLFKQRGPDTERAEELRKAMRRGKLKGERNFVKYYRKNYKENGWPRLARSEVRRWEEINEALSAEGKPQEGPFEFKMGREGILPDKVKETLETKGAPEF